MKRMSKLRVGLIGFGLLSGPVLAGNMGELPRIDMHPWSLTASLGYTQYRDMYSGDGETAVERLAIAKELFSWRMLAFGLEAGVQNGNTMRLDVP